MVPFDVNDYVSLINDPRNDYMKLYTVDRLGNIVGGAPVAYINVPIDVLKLCVAILLAVCVVMVLHSFCFSSFQCGAPDHRGWQAGVVRL